MSSMSFDIEPEASRRRIFLKGMEPFQDLPTTSEALRILEPQSHRLSFASEAAWWEVFPAATDSRFLRELGIPALGFSPMRPAVGSPRGLSGACRLLSLAF